MSTRAVLERLVENNLVVHVPPQMVGTTSRRHFFLVLNISQRLEAALYGKSGYDKRLAMLLQDIDTFTAGQIVSFGNHPYAKDKSAFIARTSPEEFGIFDIRSNNPSPALRLFGAFAEVDTFVGLTIRVRKELGGKAEPKFDDAVTEAALLWNRLFPDNKPFNRLDPRELVSHNVHIV